MVATPCDIRDRIDTLLLDGDLQTAIGLVQMLSVACESRNEFNRALDHVLEVAEVGIEVSDGERIDDQTVAVAQLGSDELEALRQVVADLRGDWELNRECLLALQP